MIDLVANGREANRTKFSTPYLGPRTSSNNRETGGAWNSAHQHSWASDQGLCQRHQDFGISVLYWSIPVPWLGPLFWYRTGSGIRICFHSGTRLTGCRTVWHSGILKDYRLSYTIWLAKGRDWHARQCKELRDGWLAFLRDQCFAPCVCQLTKDRKYGLMLG